MRNARKPDARSRQPRSRHHGAHNSVGDPSYRNGNNNTDNIWVPTGG